MRMGMLRVRCRSCAPTLRTNHRRNACIRPDRLAEMGNAWGAGGCDVSAPLQCIAARIAPWAGGATS